MAPIDAINAAVSRALYETQIETLDNFKTFLASREDVEIDFMEELITSFKNSLKSPKNIKKTIAADKKKRVPSAYTLFIKHRMHLLKTENPDIKSGKDLMSKAVEAWGGLTEDMKDKLKSTLKDNPTLNAEDLYNAVF
jgi:hypothetical protein